MSSASPALSKLAMTLPESVSKADKQPMMGFVEGHRKISRRVRRGPCRNYGACLSIHHRDLFGIGKIYEDARSGLLQLKGFRVGIKPDITNMVAVFSVDNSETAVAIADIDALSVCIVTNVVGIVGKFYALDALKRRAIEDVARPGLPVGDKDFIELRNEADALRLMQSRNALEMLAGI